MIHPDGTMYYYLQPDTLYYTKSKQLLGNIITDKENYFLSLTPKPAPDPKGSIKAYKPLEITLADGTKTELEFYDARMIKDSVFVIMYFFDEKSNKELFEAKINTIKITTPEGENVYNLKLHKAAILEKFNCLKGNIRKL